MIKDTIVQEIHEVRRQLWQECGGDSREYAQRLQSVRDECQGRAMDVEEWKRRRLAEREQSGR